MHNILNIYFMAPTGFEPATPGFLFGCRIIKAREPLFSAPENSHSRGTRSGFLIKSPVLYQAELRSHSSDNN